MKVTTINSIFEVKSGNDLELNKLDQKNGYIPFVSRTRKNNGISALVNRIENVEPLPKNTITVALSSASVLFAFLQEKPYYTAYHVACLIPKEPMTKQELLYYCTCITANRYKYNFGRQANKTIETLLVPDRSEIPEWVNRTKIQDLSHLDTPFHIKELDKDEKFAIFPFNEIFCYVKPEKHEEKRTVNLVSALTKNNGVKCLVEKKSYISGNKISISSNGIYTGTAFYQEEPFVTQDSIAIDLQGKKLNKYIAMYLLCLINNEKIRFNYGRKSGKTKLDQLKLQLPVDQHNNPDWEYMENYIKNLPYSYNI